MKHPISLMQLNFQNDDEISYQLGMNIKVDWMEKSLLIVQSISLSLSLCYLIKVEWQQKFRLNLQLIPFRFSSYFGPSPPPLPP